MKNKKTTWFMLPFVLAIWAVIGWKVYAMIKSDPTALSPVQENGSGKTAEKIIPDTFELVADYRDPFLGEVVSKAKGGDRQLRIAAPPVKKDTVRKQAVGFPKLVYFGLVKRNSDQRGVGFLSVDGNSNFIKGGEQIGNVSIGKLWKDSVEVMMGKERRVIRK
jgi:hypothetical protein